MTLTDAQKATLKAAILGNPTWDAFPNTSDGNFALAKTLNIEAVPEYIVWKTFVSKNDIGATFDGGELSGLTTAESNRLQVFALWQPDGVNPSDDDVRFLFDDVFSGAGGTVTRANLAILWKRKATEIEKIFAVGSGTDLSPSKLTFEGNISGDDVEAARNS